jgi:hypothetical protein
VDGGVDGGGVDGEDGEDEIVIVVDDDGETVTDLEDPSVFVFEEPSESIFESSVCDFDDPSLSSDDLKCLYAKYAPTASPARIIQTRTKTQGNDDF